MLESELAEETRQLEADRRELSRLAAQSPVRADLVQQQAQRVAQRERDIEALRNEIGKLR